MPEKVFDEHLGLLEPAFWSNRYQARKSLRSCDNDNSMIDKTLGFLALRGQLKNALNSRNYDSANKWLGAYVLNKEVSKTLLKKQLNVLGICIKSGHEYKDSLKQHLKVNEKSRAKKNLVKHYPLLKCMLTVAHV